MSHMAQIDLEIQTNQLDALVAACEELGLKVDIGRKNWKWFGTWVNDYSQQDAAYLHGIDPKLYGECAEAVIYDPNNKHAYEIGIVKRQDGKEGYVLLYDHYAGGMGMTKKVGDQNCTLLQQHFACQVTIKETKRKHPDWRFKVTQVGDKLCAVGVRPIKPNFR